MIRILEEDSVSLNATQSILSHFRVGGSSICLTSSSYLIVLWSEKLTPVFTLHFLIDTASFVDSVAFIIDVPVDNWKVPGEP